MKPPLVVALLLLCPLGSPLFGEERLLLEASQKVISKPDFKQPLGAEWSTGKGKWDPTEGVLKVTDLPDEHHIPVLHLATGPASLIWECEFRFNAGKSFLVGCDAQKHVGRVVIGAKSFKICEDSTEVKGKSGSHTLSETPVDLKPGDWHTLRVDHAGDRIAARLDATELQAQHAYLATPKVRWWFAASDAVEIRNVRITEATPEAVSPQSK